MPRTNRKRVREVYFYKTSSGEYKIDLVDGRDNIVKEQLYYSNRVDVNNFIEKLQDNKNTKFEVSTLGIKIYNKKPDQRMLAKCTENIFESYVKNLETLKEDSAYRHKVSALLRSVADIVDPVATDDCGCNTSVMSFDNPEIEIPVVGISPDSPIDDEVPLNLIDNIQETLDVSINLENLTFWFQDQKWQITKDTHDYDTPVPQLPKSSHNILGTMEYMINLLGVNAERNTKIGENSFRFVDQGNVFKVKHIYTGDHNTLRREK